MPKNTLPKTNMDTQNDGLEKVTAFKHSNFGYQFVRFRGGQAPFSWYKWAPSVHQLVIIKFSSFFGGDCMLDILLMAFYPEKNTSEA